MKVLSLLLFVTVAYSAEYFLCKDYSSAVGDPWFNGFHGQRFLFPGQAGKFYHVFSDQHVMVNAKFSYAEQHKGTIMNAFGVMLEGFNLTFNTDTVVPWKSSCVVTINGVEQTITSDPYFLNDCILLLWDSKKLQVRSPHYDLAFQSINKKNSHINMPYFDISIDRAGNDKSIPLGGILGQTSVRHNRISTSNEDFEVNGFFDTTSVKNKYRAAHYQCNETSYSNKKSRAYHILRLEDNGCPSGEYCTAYADFGPKCSSTKAVDAQTDCYVECKSGKPFPMSGVATVCKITVDTNGNCIYDSPDFEKLQKCVDDNYCNAVG